MRYWELNDVVILWSRMLDEIPEILRTACVPDDPARTVWPLGVVYRVSTCCNRLIQKVYQPRVPERVNR